VKLRNKFNEKFGDRCRKVRGYYLPRLKRNEPVPLTAGVLIIGSLFWDSERGRPAWRDARLNMASAQTVTAPLRYGRRAKK